MKLKINTAAGILDIINVLLVAGSWIIVLIGAISESTVKSNGTITGSASGGVSVFFYIMLGLGLILHIIGLIQSKKADISITGHVLGIIGSALFLVSMIFSLPTFILLIIAAVFTLKQAPAKK